MTASKKFMGFFWTSLYAFLVLVPIIMLLAGPRISGRPALLDFSESLGFVGLAIMTLQFLLTARIKATHEPFGTDLVYHFHRQIGIAAFFLVIAHPLLLFILDSRYLRFLNIFTSPLRSKLGVGAVLLLVGVVWMAEYRKKFKVPYAFWKIAHGILATLMIPMALYHIFTGGNYINLPWKQGLWIGYSILFTLTLLETRVFYPLRLINRPFQVQEVKAERGSVWTVTMKPINHKGFDFKPGQFAWISAWKTPFSDTEHPFTISSSAEDKLTYQMSIKNLGPFTSRIQLLKPGDKVFLDGPYGYFSMDNFPLAKRLIFIPGGIGVTPIMSMLRTMADRGDKRPTFLFYCNQEWETLTFRDEVEALKDKLSLQVVYTIERPPQSWAGESGFLNTAILNKYLTPEWKSKTSEVFLCGPESMMKAVEKALIVSGIYERTIHSERFSLN